jgi:tetratricopeptide (TPR) repeat protein
MRSIALLWLAACGASSTSPTISARPIEPADALLGIGAETISLLARPDRTADQLEADRRTARGQERRDLDRVLAVAHLYEAEEADGRDARAHRRAADRAATAAARGTRDAYLAAEMDFIGLWTAWRGGSRTAARRVERFLDRNASSGGDLLMFAWMIKGEIAFEAERWRDAATAYRYVLGSLGHPLYAYALYRTAQVWQREGRGDEAREAFGEVVSLGCPDDASETTTGIALAASRALGEPTSTTEEGRVRPSRCARVATASAEELPPGLE